ncbi:DUF2141 domain-containing protein [Sphingosinicella terrae]|uniref:DUF2141 domain-containing protein n=1 Tax=Sphingosinicella terrae TaxID=2172047 RepID=UPI0013B3D5BB|nr:DUF2141 domain-containing protein [Sphingosinicella terrae]
MIRLFSALPFLVALATPAVAANLTVEVEGVRATGGTLYVTVQDREQFMQQRGTAGTVVQRPQAGAHRFGFDVPPGEYAVSIWHDDNGNGQFDKDESHQPLDGWSMTSGETLRAEPTFDQVKTSVGTGPAALRLSMIYGR